MPNQVTIKPSNHAFALREDETILDGALREGYVIAYGCRNGACGTCKGKLLEGAVDYGVYQESALSEDERSHGLALFCQARPLGDVVIDPGAEPETWTSGDEGPAATGTFEDVLRAYKESRGQFG